MPSLRVRIIITIITDPSGNTEIILLSITAIFVSVEWFLNARFASSSFHRTGYIDREEDKLRTPEVSELVGPFSEKAVPPGTTTMNSVARELEPARALRSELRC